jgi:hypothetical protein
LLSADGVRLAEESLPVLPELAANQGAKRPTRIGIVMDSRDRLPARRRPRDTDFWPKS